MHGHFHFDSGSLALDFLNAATGGGGAEARSTASPDALLAWLNQARLTDGTTDQRDGSPPQLRTLLGEATRLVGSVEAAVSAVKRGQPLPAPDLLALNRVLEARSSSTRAVSGPGGLVLVEEVHLSDVRGLLAPVAESAVQLLTGADPARLRRCRAEDCLAWFLDTSKNGRRKWCSMSRCGNRAKVAAHYRRSQGA